MSVVVFAHFIHFCPFRKLKRIISVFSLSNERTCKTIKVWNLVNFTTFFITTYTRTYMYVSICSTYALTFRQPLLFPILIRTEKRQTGILEHNLYKGT